jgi:hypothetical protein
MAVLLSWRLNVHVRVGNTPSNSQLPHGHGGSALIPSTSSQVMEARMRKSLLALIFAGSAPLAMAIASNPASAGAAVAVPKAVDAPSAVTRVDYRGRYYHRGYRHYYRGPASYGYYAPRAYYRAPAYYAPPVAYYAPPVVVYYPPPVVVYPQAAPYRYGASYYGDGYSDW